MRWGLGFGEDGCVSELGVNVKEALAVAEAIENGSSFFLFYYSAPWDESMAMFW